MNRIITLFFFLSWKKRESHTLFSWNTLESHDTPQLSSLEVTKVTPDWTSEKSSKCLINYTIWKVDGTTFIYWFIMALTNRHLLGVASHLLAPQCMLFFVGGKIWCESPKGVVVSVMIPPCRFFGCLCTSSFCCSHPARCHAPSLGCTCPVRVKTCLSLCFSLMDPQQKLSSLCFFLVVLTFWNAIHQLRALTTIKHNVIRKNNDIMGIYKQNTCLWNGFDRSSWSCHFLARISCQKFWLVGKDSYEVRFLARDGVLA